MQSYTFLSTKLVAAQRTATDLIKAYFASCFTPEDPRTLISTPTYSVTPENVTVQLFSYESSITRFTKSVGPTKSPSKLSDSALNSLVAALSRLFSSTLNPSVLGSTPVPVQLRIVRLHHPYLNSSILAQFLALNASKYGFARLRHYVLSAIPLTTISNPTTESIILGVKVQVSGLLTTQRMAPRKTVSTVSTGTFHGLNTHVDYSSHTTKSALGSYTVKV
jgi:hypothetical protein